MRQFIFTSILISISFFGSAQSCCSGGSSCPIAGSTAAGVLAAHQLELNNNFQYINTTKFLSGDTAALNFLDRFHSAYNYMRIGYGVTEKLTLSIEGGYFFNKTQVGLNKSDTITGKGFGDIILFPRYNAVHHTGDNGNFDLTVGVGIKIPVGSYNDSLGWVEPFSGNTYYIRKPPAVQSSTGAQDFVFYASAFRGFTNSKFRVFANGIFIKKGWNPLGEKAGNYSSISLFAGKTLLKNVSATLQLKAENVQPLQLNQDLYLMGFYNYDTKSTGAHKLLFIPQLSYSYKSFTISCSDELPLYQFVNGTQIASQQQINVGLTYRFFPFTKKIVSGFYYCPMHPDQTSSKPGSCPICHMDLELKK